VAIGSDHSAWSQKEFLKQYLKGQGYTVVDIGCSGGQRVDYPDIARAVCHTVVTEACDRGIVLDGAGIGSSMACNKVRGIRAALCYDVRTVINSREHNNANVLVLGGPLHAAVELSEMVSLWLETAFAGGRHLVRVNKIMAIERGESS
jgi:ribose 5-phosphate isomerase B